MASDEYAADGISIRPSTDYEYMIVEPQEGSGRMPCTAIPYEAAREQFNRLREFTCWIRSSQLNSYLADFIDEVGDEMEQVLEEMWKVRDAAKG